MQIMKKSTLIKHHKWLGIILCPLLLMFCVSGILLGHRQLISNVNVSRSVLPSRYEYHNWNGGLLRGTLPIDNALAQRLSLSSDTGRQVLLYGNGGMWLTNATASAFKDFNRGLPTGADQRQILGVQQASGCLYGVSRFALYRYDVHGSWHRLSLPLQADEQLADISSHGDTLVVLSRSYAYIALPPYNNFRRLQLPTPCNYENSTTVFRTVWLLHSGALFGTAGRLVADGIAIVLAVLCISGIVFWLRPKRKQWLRFSFLLHRKAGRYTIALTMLIVLTGWCLRPPALIALVSSKVPIIPGTTLSSSNPWHDKLRMMRYDDNSHDWLLSTADGFYSINLTKHTVEYIATTPPVSVMGLNVLQSDADGKWWCGSFSGLYVWDRQNNTITDYYTNKPAAKQTGAPFGKKPISGMSVDLSASSNGKCLSAPIIADYYAGTPLLSQPDDLCTLPMSLWQVALEAHSGRLFIGSIATYFFIFIAGLLAIWCLWTGYRI